MGCARATGSSAERTKLLQREYDKAPPQPAGLGAPSVGNRFSNCSFCEMRLRTHPRIEHQRTRATKINRTARYDAQVVQDRCSRHKQIRLMERVAQSLALLYKSTPDQKNLFIRLKQAI